MSFQFLLLWSDDETLTASLTFLSARATHRGVDSSPECKLLHPANFLISVTSLESPPPIPPHHGLYQQVALPTVCPRNSCYGDCCQFTYRKSKQFIQFSKKYFKEKTAAVAASTSLLYEWSMSLRLVYIGHIIYIFTVFNWKTYFIFHYSGLYIQLSISDCYMGGCIILNIAK